MKTYLASMTRVDTAEFEITGIEELAGASPLLHVEIRYDFAGTAADKKREEHIGQWQTQWSLDQANGWRVRRWETTQETFSRARAPIFIDVTSQALGETESYKKQMLHGVDYWRTVLDGACGMDVYGNNGVAVGDFDNDGLDDLYVCQPPGLPNRLYHNRGDGTFEDVTEKAGVGVLDGTACALFADFENKGLQDLLVVCGSGPLLFLNQGNGKFLLKRDAFRLRGRRKGRSRTPLSPTMTATAASIFISACTATIWASTNITILLLILTRAMGLRTFCFTTKAMELFRIAPKPRD